MNKHYEFFSKYIKDLKESPVQQKVICPFSNHDTESSLSINLEKGYYYCHGCGEKGDIVEIYSSSSKRVIC